MLCVDLQIYQIPEEQLVMTDSQQEFLSSIDEIYDMHTHIFPGKIAEKAVASIGKFYDLTMHEKGTAEDLVARGKAARVSKFLVCSTATTGAQVNAINDFVSKECSIYPEFLGFGSLHPDYEKIDGPGSIAKEVDRMISLGLRGIKLHPDFQHFDIDAPEAYSIYEAAEGKLPLLIHMGDNRYDYSKPFRLANILKTFPKLTVIAAHLGGYSCWDEVKALGNYLGHPNIYIDTCSAIQFLPKEESVNIIRTHGVDKVFWGTDFPMWSHETELERFLNLGLTEDENRKILSDNAKKFFNK